LILRSVIKLLVAEQKIITRAAAEKIKWRIFNYFGCFCHLFTAAGPWPNTHILTHLMILVFVLGVSDENCSATYWHKRDIGQNATAECADVYKIAVILWC